MMSLFGVQERHTHRYGLKELRGLPSSLPSITHPGVISSHVVVGHGDTSWRLFADRWICWCFVDAELFVMTSHGPGLAMG